MEAGARAQASSKFLGEQSVQSGVGRRRRIWTAASSIPQNSTCRDLDAQGPGCLAQLGNYDPGLWVSHPPVCDTVRMSAPCVQVTTWVTEPHICSSQYCARLRGVPVYTNNDMLCRDRQESGSSTDTSVGGLRACGPGRDVTPIMLPSP